MPTFSWSVVSSAGLAATTDADTQGPGPETLPKDLQLTAGGDLLIQANDLVLNSGQTALEQDLASRLRTVRGEWFLDTSVGLPYFEDVFVKKPNLNAFRTELRAAIEATPGVVEVTALDLKLDNSTRQLAITFNARTDLGELGVVALDLVEI
jgi:hypothetical protein